MFDSEASGVSDQLKLFLDSLNFDPSQKIIHQKNKRYCIVASVKIQNLKSNAVMLSA